MLAVQVGRGDFGEAHSELARKEASQRDLELRVGEEEDALARQARAMSREGSLGAFAPRLRHALEVFGAHAEGIGRGLKPAGGAFFTQREG